MSGWSSTEGRLAATTRVPLRPQALALLAVMALGLSAPASAAGPAVPSTPPAPPAVSPATGLAGTLLATVPPGSRLAVRPFDPRETGLPRAVGARLYESMLNAVLRAARGREVTVLARERLREVHGTLEEFDQGDVASMIEAAQADIEIICKASPVAEGVILSCAAVDLTETVTVAHGVARFALERHAAPLELAVAEIAGRLTEAAPAASPVERVMLLESATGGRSDLGAYVGQRLEGEIVRRMAERARREGNEARAAAVLGTAPDAAGEVPRYRLQGIIWRLDAGRIRVEARLRLGRRSVAGAGADISVASLPPGLVAEAAAGSGRQGAASGVGRMHEAVAEAVISDRLDRDSALRAARNLARARVVAQALDLPPPAVTEVTTEADAVAVFGGFLDAGLPVDERFREVRPAGDTNGGQRIAVRLTARVVPIGSLIRPAVNARLEHAVYKAMEPMRVEIRSEEKAHLGLFAWGADDRVVRLYPRGTSRLVIGAGETLDLPRPGEGRILTVPLPLPGNREDHEALVVVASARPIDFAALAAAAGATVAGTMQRAVEGSGFLAALAGQDPARIAVIWLPYQVHD